MKKTLILKTTKTIMNISEAVQTIKQVGLNVYTPKTKDSGFIKVYVEPITKLLPKLSGNSLKVLLALSSKLQWNEVQVCLLYTSPSPRDS